MIWTGLSAAALGAWVYLLVFHGRFWRCDQRLPSATEPQMWPAVVAVVPARDEAAVIARALESLLGQHYPGSFGVVLVDDESSDGTGDIARVIAHRHPRGAALSVIDAPPRPPGWVGKMWAVATGVEYAERAGAADYLWLTDADVEHPPDHLRRLVAVAEADERVLVSQMVLLDHRGFWPALLVPAFVYFFQQLYPFRRVNRERSRIAAAAGGCMLVRVDALRAAGSIAAIRDEVIDDCALARRLKRQGPIWLGLSEQARSIRPYTGLAGVWKMVARSAYTQLNHSPPLLVATVVALTLVYLAPPALALGWPLHRSIAAAAMGAVAWALMAITFVPTLRLYRRSVAVAFALPVAGLLYVAMTLDSAWRHWRGKGVEWKGRSMRERSRETDRS